MTAVKRRSEVNDTGVGGEVDNTVIRGRCRGFPATQDASLLEDSNKSYRNKPRMTTSTRLEETNHGRKWITRTWRRRIKPSRDGTLGVPQFHMM